jgi:hypothetical protein
MKGKCDKLKGRRGSLPNLFTGKTFCKTCGGSLRVTGGGRKHANGKARRTLQCSRFVETNLCADATRYDLHHYEPAILTQDVIAAIVAPRIKVCDDERSVAEELAAAKLTLQQLDETKEELRPLMSSSPTIRADYLKTVGEFDAYAKTIPQLEIRLSGARAPASRRLEVFRFMGALVKPALNGDTDARMKLRALLAPHNFRIAGHPAHGGMVVTVDDVEHDILPPDADPSLMLSEGDG